MDDSPLEQRERDFGFLNRTSEQPFVLVRDEIERWFSQFPADIQPGLVARARGDDQAWTSVYWELYLHNFLRRAGFSVEVEPTLPGVTTRVDFLATRGKTKIAVEATTALGSVAEKAARMRRLAIYDGLRRVRSPNFELEVEFVEEGPLELAVRPHRDGIESWLMSLDPDAVEGCVAESGYDTLPTHHIMSAGWEVELTAWPRAKEDRGEHHRALGVFDPVQVRMIDDASPLRRSLGRKGSHYGSLDVPFVVAVLMLGHFADETDVISALFGTPVLRYTQRLKEEDPPPRVWTDRRDDGYFLTSTGPVHPGVSALLVGQRLQHSNISTTSPVIWHHPSPALPLGRPFPLPSIHLEMPAGVIRREAAELPINEVLGICPAWPGFPRQIK